MGIQQLSMAMQGGGEGLAEVDVFLLPHETFNILQRSVFQYIDYEVQIFKNDQ